MHSHEHLLVNIKIIIIFLSKSYYFAVCTTYEFRNSYKSVQMNIQIQIYKTFFCILIIFIL